MPLVFFLILLFFFFLASSECYFDVKQYFLNEVSITTENRKYLKNTNLHSIVVFLKALPIILLFVGLYKVDELS